MRTHFTPTVRERLELREAQDFSDLLYRQSRNAPWVGLSVLTHGAVLGLLFLFPPGADAPVEKPVAMVMTQREEAPELKEEPEPDVTEIAPEEVEKPDDVEEIFDAEISDHPETDDDQDYEETRGALDNHLANGIDWVGTAAVIGIGNNQGGPFGNGRGGNDRLGGRGKGTRTETAVKAGLDWLANHQSPDGKWDAEHFSDQCKLNRCDGPGEGVFDVGVSGLALLAFLGRGETHVSGPYRDTVKNGLKYLRQIQDSEGCFGPRTSPSYMYNHACAALAMAEAYGLTGSRTLRKQAQRGIDFVHHAQNPYLAWRYGIKDGDNDTSVTGWMTMVLKSGAMAGLDVDKSALKSAVGWVDRVTEPEFGRVGYQNRGGQSSRTTDQEDRFPRDQTEAMTAVGLTTRIFAGQDPGREPMIQKGADLLVQKLPRWDTEAGTIDHYYWYYGTLAMFQVGGDRWKKWEAAMKTEILAHQRLDKGRDEYGSWDPEGPWAPEGGRVYSTALMTMCLEIYYRYGKVFGTYGD